MFWEVTGQINRSEIPILKLLVHHFCPEDEILHCKENFYIKDSLKIYWESDRDNGLDNEISVQFKSLDSTSAQDTHSGIWTALPKNQR